MGLNEIQLYSKLWKCNNIYLIDNSLWINYGNSKLILLLPRRYSESSKSINRHHAMFFYFLFMLRKDQEYLYSICLCNIRTDCNFIIFNPIWSSTESDLVLIVWGSIDAILLLISQDRNIQLYIKILLSPLHAIVFL